MKNFEGIADAANEVRNWIIRNEEKMPVHLQERLAGLTTTGISPVDLIVGFTEAVYANPKGFPAEAEDIAAGAAVLCENFGFHGMAVDGRGSKIAAVLDGKEVADAPEGKADFQKTPEDPAPTPAG